MLVLRRDSQLSPDMQALAKGVTNCRIKAFLIKDSIKSFFWGVCGFLRKGALDSVFNLQNLKTLPVSDVFKLTKLDV